MQDTQPIQHTTQPPVTVLSKELPIASPWLLFGGIFIIASIGGIGALLRSGQEVTARLVLSALINSGLVGLVIALYMWHHYGGESPFLILCVSTLAGLGGASTIDLIFQFVRKKLGLPNPNDTNEQPDDD